MHLCAIRRGVVRAIALTVKPHTPLLIFVYASYSIPHWSSQVQWQNENGPNNRVGNSIHMTRDWSVRLRVAPRKQSHLLLSLTLIFVHTSYWIPHSSRVWQNENGLNNRAVMGRIQCLLHDYP